MVRHHYGRTVVETTTIISTDQQAKKRKAGFKEVDNLLQEQGPLEDEQQQKLVREFEELQLKSARAYRGIFGAGALLLMAFFAWSAWQQHVHPFEQKITGELQAGGSSAGSMAGALAFQAVALAAVAGAMLMGLPPKGAPERGCMPAPLQQKLALASGTLISALCAAYWVHTHMRMVEKFGVDAGARWELLWVPAAPPAYCVLCWWVLHSLADTGGQVAALKGLMYKCHGA